MEERERSVVAPPHRLGDVWNTRDLELRRVHGEGASVLHKPTGEMSACLWADTYAQNLTIAIANLKHHATHWTPEETNDAP